MKTIALSIEQMKHLESLGLDTSDASMYWFKDGDFEQLMYYKGALLDESTDIIMCIPAYTLQDILEKLDKIREFEVLFNISSHTIKAKVYDFEGCEGVSKSFTKNSILKASYQMLLWCIKNNYIKTNN